MSTSAPAGFTDDEITASVESLVLSTISRPYDTLGTRRTDITFTQVQQAAAGVFLLYRDAPFYILFLATKRALEAVATEAQLLSQILTAVSSIGRNVLPVNDLTPLANASAALSDLSNAVAQRQQALQSTSIPAFQRYQTNISQFLATNGPNVKDNGQLVMTPQQAQSALPGLITQLQTSHLALVSSSKLLANAIANYSALNLPSLVAQSVLSASKSVLDNYLATLTSQSPTDRLNSLRALVLDLLAQQGIVAQFTSFQGPSAVFSVTGVGTPFSDSTHLATPASVTALPGPYPITNGKNILDFFLDGTYSAKFGLVAITSVTAGTNLFEANFNYSGDFTTFGLSPGDIVYPFAGANAGSRWVVKTITPTQVLAVGDHDPVVPDLSPSIVIWPAPTTSVAVANSLLPKLESFLGDPYNIDSGNDLFLFTVDGITVTTTLPHGSTVTAAQIVAAINAAILAQVPSKPVVAEIYASPLRFDGVVTISLVSPGVFQFQVLAGNLDGLGITTADSLLILTGPDKGYLHQLSFVDSSPAMFVQTTGGSITTGDREEIQIGQFNRIRIRCSDPGTCLRSGTTLAVSVTTSNTASVSIGFTQGLSSTGRQVRVADFIKDFNQRTTTIVASSASQLDFTGPMRSDPLSPTKVICLITTGVGTVTASGTDITVTDIVGDMSGVAVGNIVCLRTGSVANATFTVTSVSDTSIAASGLSSVSSASGVQFDVGPDFLFVPVAGRTVTVNSPNPNSGKYEVASQTAVPFELLLTANLPMRQSLTAVPVQMTGTVSIDSVVLSNTTTTTDSSIQVLGSAGDLLFSAGEGTREVGTSPWFQLPSIPLGLQSGDFIDVYESNYVTLTNEYTIESLETSTAIAKISPEMPSDQSWTFSTTTPPPFALLKAGNVEDSSVLTAALNVWLANPTNTAAYFTDLNRFLNPILVNANPTAVEINDAMNRLLDLQQLLTVAGATQRSANTALSLESILSAYTSNSVSAVDNLITTFSNKGADRAVDILLTADFGGFFGLTVDTSSYASALLSAARTVAQNDMSVSKVNRDNAVQGSLITSTTSNDYEYSSDDIETAAPVDPPITG